MSYSNGVGRIPQAINTITTSEAKPVTPAGSTANLANGNQEPITNVQHADHADLSSAGAVVAQALEGSDVRSAKVASLQQAIATGNYSVSSSDVADKIIQSLLD
jgi:negative regulator of flagellin synthesis FlgM